MSSTCGTPHGKGVESSVDVDALAKSLEVRLIEANSKLGIGKQPSIFKVPELLRRSKSEAEAYEPKMLLLGPYNRHKQHLQAMNQLKLRCLQKFLKRNRNISLGQYLAQIKERESEARMAYAEDCNMGSNDFVEMLLLDCCFVLEIIWFWKKKSNIVNQDGTNSCNPFMITKYSFQVMIRDMLLFENQLPFFLISHLFNSASSSDECESCTSETKESLEQLITKFFKIIIPSIKVRSTADATSSKGKSKTLINTKDRAQSSKEYLHILDLVHSSISPKIVNQEDHEKRHKANVHWIPCAMELRNAGIHFVIKGEDDKERHMCRNLWNHIWCTSETRARSFLDITFKGSRMEIPKLMVDDDTDTILRNLIAFEQCYVKAEPHVTAYAMLMDQIINTEADVELLQQSGVLMNGLGDSMEVAILFNKLCKEVVMPDECYSRVYDDVDRYRNTACNTWQAKLNHDYFSNPWAIISLIAAFLLFALTITQTVYSVLSYVKP